MVKYENLLEARIVLEKALWRYYRLYCTDGDYVGGILVPRYNVNYARNIIHVLILPVWLKFKLQDIMKHEDLV